MENEKSENDSSQTTPQEPLPSKPIIPKSVQNIANRHFSLRSKVKKQRRSQTIYRPNTENYNDNNIDIPIRKSYNNTSYQNDNDNDDDDFENFLDVDIEDLQDLVRRQNTEIHELEEEYQSWYETYTHRVNATKLRHKEEQRQLLRSLQRQRQFNATQGHPLQFSHVYPSQMTPTYPVFPGGVFTTRSTSRSVATTYRPYMVHRLHMNNLNQGAAMPVDRL